MFKYKSTSSIAVALLSVAFLLSVAPTVNAIELTDELTAAQKKYTAGDLDGALKNLEPLLAPTNLDQTLKLRARQLTARVLHSRGEDHFRHARIAESVTDFERELKMLPDQSPEHWQLGIAYYYAGDYQKGAKQFELHKTVNPQDVENAAWHFLCVVRSPEESIESARKSLIRVTRDSRVPMSQIQQLFAGKLTPEDVLRAVKNADGPAKFYADLYVGLHYEALGKADESLRLITVAAENPAAKHSYMGDVARVHAKLRKKAASTKQSPRPEGSK